MKTKKGIFPNQLLKLDNFIKTKIMKNVFFALAFMLVGTFAFANTEVISDIDVDKIESLINVDNLDIQNLEEDFGSCGFTVNFDDGGSGDWGGSGSFWYSNNSCTWGDIFDMIDSFFPGWSSATFN
jgi:hypothetical protein